MVKKLNENGSLPLVLVIVMIIAMSIATLASMLLTEKINMAQSITTDIDKLYAKDSTVEVVKNVTNQVLREKEWVSLENERIIDSDDLEKVQDIVSNTVMPGLDIQGNVRLEGSIVPPELSRYCQEVFDGNGVFINFNCSNEVFDIELKMILENDGNVQTGLLKIENMKVYTENMGNVIRLDMNDAAIKLKKALY